jgi:amidase/fatty acid amide hydrolase 2
MPIGIQLISLNGNEDALFRLGERIEQQFRGYVRCR